MRTYSNYAPTPLDVAGLNLEDQQDWLVAPVGINRDSGPLDLSNWEVFQNLLPGPEGGAWEIHRFGHWACGWYEIIILRPGTPAIEIGEETARALEYYPVLDDSDLSAREDENVCQAWDSWACEDSWTALGKLLPDALAEELTWDREGYLKARGLSEETLSETLFVHSQYETHSDGPYWTHSGAEELLAEYPTLKKPSANLQRDGN